MEWLRNLTRYKPRYTRGEVHPLTGDNKKEENAAHWDDYAGTWPQLDDPMGIELLARSIRMRKEKIWPSNWLSRLTPEESKYLQEHRNKALKIPEHLRQYPVTKEEAAKMYPDEVIDKYGNYKEDAKKLIKEATMIEEVGQTFRAREYFLLYTIYIKKIEDLFNEELRNLYAS